VATRVLIKGEVDLLSALVGHEAAIELVIEPPARVEVFAQQLESALRSDDSLSEARTRAADPDIEVVVLSLAGDLTRGLWRQSDTGELVDSREKGLDRLEPAIDDFDRSAALVVDRLASRNDPLVVWFAASTVSGADEPHQWEGEERPFSVLANRLNLAVARLSQAKGVCFVDADRLIAELGAGGHVQGPFQYSGEASSRLAGEFERILIETGRLSPSNDLGASGE
jgi:hypothetical protein